VDGDWRGRDVADEAIGALRDAPPDPLTPIDPAAPVSGHAVPPEAVVPASAAPEHDWSAARDQVYPMLRAAGTTGPGRDDPPDPTRTGLHAHAQPLVAPGPAELVVSYALSATGFDVLVNGDHLLSWGIAGRELDEAATANLARWSATAGWSDEASGERHLISSSTGHGHDAARILLPDVRGHLRAALDGGSGTRILIGLPERHLLLAGALPAGDETFVDLFRAFIAEQWEGADEPLDQRVFELRGEELVEFSP
jgi:hypothetical protein